MNQPQSNGRRRWSYNPLPRNDENYAILIAVALFYLITSSIVPSMKRYLALKNISYTNTDDFQALLKIFQLEIKKDRNFLRVVLSKADVSRLFDVRNQVNHDNLGEIFINWRTHFGVLRRLCQSINDSNAEVEATRIYNLVNSGDATEAVRFHFRFSTRNHDRSFAALCLTQIIFMILIKYLAKNLWHFLLTKNRNCSHSPSLDLYINLKTAIAEQLKNKNYLWFRGILEKDGFTLSNCLFARNANRHGQYVDIQTYWESFIESIIKLLERLNRIADATAVRNVLNKLTSARRNRTEVNFVDLFNDL
jgi:hypothetical protein